MTARRLLAWTDLEARRRVGPARVWGRRVAVAAALTGWVAWQMIDAGPVAALGTWQSVVVAVFASTMVATALGMFWRHDAAMLARLPVSGRVLLQAAVVRAVRSALIAAGTVVVAAVPLIAGGGLGRVPLAALARGMALVGTLTIAAAGLIPAAAGAAALLVAGGRATRAARTMVSLAAGTSPRHAVAAAARAASTRAPEQVPTTVLGGLPGSAAAWMVILAITVRWWVLDGEVTAVGPAPYLLAAAVVVSLVALAAVLRRGEGMAVALREVAALDRQRLAHLEIHPPRGLEVVVMRLLGRRAGLVYSKTARLMRRRYPMAWVVGLSAWVVGVVLAIWPPDAAGTWAIGIAAVTGAYAVVLARRLGQPPIELPHVTASLPLAGTGPRVRFAWVLSWVAVFAAPATLLAVLGVMRARG